MRPARSRILREGLLLGALCVVAALSGAAHWTRSVRPERPRLASVRARRINPLDVEPAVNRALRRHTPGAFVVETHLVEPPRGGTYYSFLMSDRERRWALRVSRQGELLGKLWELRPLSIAEIPRRGRPPAPEPGTPPLQAWRAAAGDSVIYRMAGFSPADVLLEWEWPTVVEAPRR